MTDRTHPDSGSPIAYSHYATYAEYVEALHARIAELEAQLSSSGFTAADMATASAHGFRDGVASVAASAPAPSGHIKEPYTVAEIKAKIASNDYSAELLLQHAMLHLDRLAASAGSEPVAIYHGRCVIDCGAHGHLDMELLKMIPAGSKLYTHPSPPEGMVRGWMPIETAPKGELVLLWSSVKRGEPFIGDWADYMRYNQPRFTHWSRWIPTPPTTSAGSGKGE